MRILVTGSSGFLGSALIKRLNEDVILYDRDNNISESLDNKKLLKIKLKGVDVVYHLAGINNPKSIDLFKVNVDGTKNLIDAVKELKQNTKIIYASTFGIYKTPKKGDLIDENYPIEPRNDYGKSKLEAEKLILKNNQNIVFRLSNIYGPGMLPGKHSVVANFIDSVFNKKIASVYEKDATRDFIYIDDVIDALIKSLDLEVGGVFNICTGDETSIINLIKIIEKKTVKKFILDFSTISTGSGYWRGSYKKAEKILKWKPRVNINDGISKILN